jgi:tetratricopeptide (TPR) repeat protein
VISWQTTVVGDPLYRPFGKDADQLHRRLGAQHRKLLEWSFLRLINLNLGMGRPMTGASDLLEQLDQTKHSAVLSEKLADLYSAQGKPSSAVHSYLQALQLDPTPQQRLRLRLTLGEKLLALDRASEAYEQYQQVLQENPAYPDKLAIYRKLLALAQKLDKKADAEAYQAAINRLSPPPPKP